MRAIGGDFRRADTEELSGPEKATRAKTARRQLAQFGIALVLLAAVLVQLIWSEAQGVVTSVQVAAGGNASAAAAPLCDEECGLRILERENAAVLHPLLSSLVSQPFFRYFKVSLYNDCPFWPDDSMCALPDCSVCECPADEVPLPWRAGENALEMDAPAGAAAPAACGEAAEAGDASSEDAGEGLVDRTLDAGAGGWRAGGGGGGGGGAWTVEDGSEGSYVNLLLNPERYTGYKGEHARRVWSAIYAQPCFDGLGGLCAAGDAPRPAELLMFYRLVSGMHASISAHIAAEYLLGRGRGRGGGDWGPNYGLYQERLGSHPERVANLAFVLRFALRAVQRAGPFLQAADYGTGQPGEDARTAQLVGQLAGLRLDTGGAFDETQLFQGGEELALREALRGHFRNMSAVMDCVGCENCRLWGKVQVTGLGTALKILFGSDGALELQRNEVIALINTLHRLSESLLTNAEMREAIASGDAQLLDAAPAPSPWATM